MKHSILLVSTLALTLGGGSVRGQGNSSHGDPYNPIGSLDVTKTHVLSGTKAQLSWDINYPVTAPDLVLIGPTGTLTAKKDLHVTVSVAGVAFQSGTQKLQVGLWINSGSGWVSSFIGRSNDVQPSQPVFDQIVQAGQTIDFAGRGRSSSGSWYDTRWTASNDSAVIGLVNGQEVPDYAPAYSQGDIESFLSGYIGKSNNGHGNNLDGVDVSNPGEGEGGPNGEPDTDYNGDGSYEDDEVKTVVTIGPRDLIYLFELASRDPGDWYFDMQDLVIIVTVEEL